MSYGREKLANTGEVDRGNIHQRDLCKKDVEARHNCYGRPGKAACPGKAQCPTAACDACYYASAPVKTRAELDRVGLR